MTELPGTWSVPVVRADFTDDAAWERIVGGISESTEEGFGADVEFVEDRGLSGTDEQSIAAAYPPDTLANMDYRDFAGAADPDGVFRGF